MPRRFMVHCKVDRFIPRRAAAPFGPPTTQPVSWTDTTFPSPGGDLQPQYVHPRPRWTLRPPTG
jgi:hypothetical protein